MQCAKLAELAKSYSDIAFNTLVDVAINGRSDSALIAAANSILDRGYGKPKSDGGLSLRHFIASKDSFLNLSERNPRFT